MRAFCTVVSHAYFPFARALASSLEASGNGDPLYILVTDADGTVQSGVEGVRCIGLADLSDSGPVEMRYYFDAFEFCNALKPFLLKHLFNEGFESVIYLDSDIMATGSFERIWKKTQTKSLLLTPHHLAPPPLNLEYTNEASIADMGFLNGGFAAWRRGQQAEKILDWMCTRFPIHGFCDRRAGMFVDQKLLPLVLQYFSEEVEVLFDPGLNVAFWNAHERNVEWKGSGYQVKGQELTFFHMSGFRLAKPDYPCSYLSPACNGAILSAAPWFAHVLEQYRSLLSQHWWSGKTPNYRFSHLEDLELTPGLRRIFFRKRVLSRRDREVQKVMLLDSLKRIKRRLFPYRDA